MKIFQIMTLFVLSLANTGSPVAVAAESREVYRAKTEGRTEMENRVCQAMCQDDPNYEACYRDCLNLGW